MKLINQSNNPTPSYQTLQSAGMDIHANIGQQMIMTPGQTVVIPTGIFIELSPGYEAQIRSRSGLAAKYSVVVLNSPGTIDPDYRGEIKVILANHSNSLYYIQPGDRIAQMVIAKYEQVIFEEVEELSQTERGRGGLGSTGQ